MFLQGKAKRSPCPSVAVPAAPQAAVEHATSTGQPVQEGSTLDNILGAWSGGGKTPGPAPRCVKLCVCVHVCAGLCVRPGPCLGVC